MSIGESWLKFKHIAYRLKMKLLYSNDKVRKLVQSFWSIAGESDGVKLVYKNEYRIFDALRTSDITDKKVEQKFDWENTTYSLQQDAIYHAAGKIYIEPRQSLAFMPGRKFIVQSKSPAHVYLIPKIRTYFLRNKSQKSTQYEALVHFDGHVGVNLYHFFGDAWNALMLVYEQVPDTRTLPVLVHEKVYNTRWMQELLKHAPFNEVNWVVQGSDEWVHTNNLYKGVPTMSWWHKTYRQMQQLRPAVRPFRKVFLNRKPNYQRRLNNNAEIEAILVAHDFQIVYAEDLTYAEQICLFAETAYLVSIHGAGVTNLIFSEMPSCHLLEIFAENLLHPHFYWLYGLLGLKYYDGICGNKLDINWNFSIDAADFENKLNRMLAHKEAVQ